MLAVALAIAFSGDPGFTICEVLKKPAAHTSQILHIHADILLALPHGVMLVDKRCPKAGLRLGYDLPEADSTAKDLVPSIRNNCSLDANPNEAPALVTGKLAYSATGHIEFRLLSITLLQNYPCPQPGQPLPKVDLRGKPRPPNPW